MRVARILKIVKLRSILNRLEQFAEMVWWGHFGIALIRVILAMVLLSHFSACFWYMAGVSGLPEGCTDKPWTCDAEGEYWAWFLTIDWNDPAWRSDGDNRLLLYIHSIYFAMATMTTVGYGDIHPISKEEKQFAVVMLLIAIIAFSACVGSITELVKTMNASKGLYRSQMTDLARYIRWRRLPYDLQMRLRRYLQFRWEHESDLAAKEDHILAQVSPSLRKQICVHLYGTHMQKAPFLSWVSKHRLPFEWLLVRCKGSFRAPGEMLFFAGQKDSTIWVMVKGKLATVEKELENGNGDVEGGSTTAYKSSRAKKKKKNKHGKEDDDLDIEPEVADILLAKEVQDTLFNKKRGSVHDDDQMKLRVLEAPIFIGESNILLLDKLQRPTDNSRLEMSATLPRTDETPTNASGYSGRTEAQSLGLRRQRTLNWVVETFKSMGSQRKSQHGQDAQGQDHEDEDHREIEKLLEEPAIMVSMREYTAICLTHCQLITLETKDLIDVLTDYPFLWDEYEEFKKEHLPADSQEEDKEATRSPSKDSDGNAAKSHWKLAGSQAMALTSEIEIPKASGSESASEVAPSLSATLDPRTTPLPPPAPELLEEPRTRAMIDDLRAEMQTELREMRSTFLNEATSVASQLHAAAAEVRSGLETRAQNMEHITQEAPRVHEVPSSTGEELHETTKCSSNTQDIRAVAREEVRTWVQEEFQGLVRQEVRRCLREDLVSVLKEVPKAAQEAPKPGPAPEDIKSLRRDLRETQAKLLELTSLIEVMPTNPQRTLSNASSRSLIEDSTFDVEKQEPQPQMLGEVAEDNPPHWDSPDHEAARIGRGSPTPGPPPSSSRGAPMHPRSASSAPMPTQGPPPQGRYQPSPMRQAPPGPPDMYRVVDPRVPPPGHYIREYAPSFQTNTPLTPRMVPVHAREMQWGPPEGPPPGPIFYGSGNGPPRRPQRPRSLEGQAYHSFERPPSRFATNHSDLYEQITYE
jgi:hypothetical protein